MYFYTIRRSGPPLQSTIFSSSSKALHLDHVGHSWFIASSKTKVHYLYLEKIFKVMFTFIHQKISPKLKHFHSATKSNQTHLQLPITLPIVSNNNTYSNSIILSQRKSHFQITSRVISSRQQLFIKIFPAHHSIHPASIFNTFHSSLSRLIEWRK